MTWKIYNYECSEAIDEVEAPDYSAAEEIARGRHGLHIMVLETFMDDIRRKVAVMEGKPWPTEVKAGAMG